MANHDAFTLRAATADDVPQAIDLATVVLAEYGMRFNEGTTTDADLLALPGSFEARGGMFLVALDAAGRVVGMCGVAPVAPATYELRKMYLRREARGTGLGSRLLAQTEAWLRARGAERLVLDTADAMADAIAFYERKGFVRDDAQIRAARATRGYAKALTRHDG